MLQFIKMLDYDRTPTGTMFHLLCEITLQTIDPVSKHPDRLLLSQDMIFHSTLCRASGCILRQPGKTYVGLDSLREIPFDLASFCTEEEWQIQRSVIVREKFNDHFITDRLPVSRESIFTEITEFLRLVEKYPTQGVAAVSHSFRMKIFEAFIRTRGSIVDHPELIRDFIFSEQRTFDFGEGFSASWEEIHASIQK